MGVVEIGSVVEGGGETVAVGADEVTVEDGLEYIGEVLTWWHRRIENNRAMV